MFPRYASTQRGEANNRVECRVRDLVWPTHIAQIKLGLENDEVIKGQKSGKINSPQRSSTIVQSRPFDLAFLATADVHFWEVLLIVNRIVDVCPWRT